MAAKPYKRRTYILQNSSQSKYIFSYFALFCLGLLFFSTLFSLMSMDTTTITYANSQIHVGNTPSMLLKKMLGSGWIIIIVGGALLFILSTMMTHRVAGPAYRIEQSLKKMLSGEFGFRIILRKGDELKSIARKVERLSMSIARQEEALVQHRKEMEFLIGNLDMKDVDRKKLEEKNAAMTHLGLRCFIDTDSRNRTEDVGP